MHGGERGGTKGQRGSDSPATRARPSWPASALRVRTPHYVEIRATDGATVGPGDAHTPRSRPPCAFVHRILLKSTQGEAATT